MSELLYDYGIGATDRKAFVIKPIAIYASTTKILGRPDAWLLRRSRAGTSAKKCCACLEIELQLKLMDVLRKRLDAIFENRGFQKKFFFPFSVTVDRAVHWPE